MPGSWKAILSGRDIEEAAAMVGVDFIVNVVLDAQKRSFGQWPGM